MSRNRRAQTIREREMSHLDAKLHKARRSGGTIVCTCRRKGFGDCLRRHESMKWSDELDRAIQKNNLCALIALRDQERANQRVRWKCTASESEVHGHDLVNLWNALDDHGVVHAAQLPDPIFDSTHILSYFHRTHWP